MAKKKVFILYDGSNFYHSLKRLGFHNLLNFNFFAFNQFLTNTTNYQATYYIGAIRQERNNPKSQKLYQAQAKLFARLQKHHLNIYKGYMLKSNGVYHEKGVDVKIALDIAIGAYEDLYDQLYLISSDTDIIPAIHKAQSLGKDIIYVGFKKARVSQAMLYNCRHHRLLTKSDLLPFVK